MIDRYSRQERFDKIGKEGQQKIFHTSVCIIGAGALGASSSEMLVRAGIQRVTIIDRDLIEWTNLHRQLLYSEQDVIDQLPKAVAAEKRLKAINRQVEVRGIVADITPKNVLEYIEGHDLVIDATDNIETRLLVNDAAFKLNIPFFMGACVGSYGLTFPIGIHEDEPCLHCLLETLPSQSLTCDTVGVINPIVVTVAARQVAQVLKFIAEGTLKPKLETTDVWTGERATIDVLPLKKPNCPTCSEQPTYPFLTAEDAVNSAVLCGRDTVQLSWPAHRRIDVETFVQAATPLVSNLKRNAHLVVCEFEQHRLVFFKDGRMFIHGMKDVTEARKLVTKILG